MKTILFSFVKTLLIFFAFIIGLPIVFGGMILRKPRNSDLKPRLIWGPEAIINNKYWSNAMKKIGYESITLMENYYPISNQRDFDKYLSDFLPDTRFTLVSTFFKALRPYMAFFYALCNFDVFHHPFTGGFLGGTPLRKLEPLFLRWSGCKSVITGYGADYMQYSKIIDRSLQHALLTSYPQAARVENKISTRVRRWIKHADAIIGSYIGGVGRWDVFPVCAVTIDTDLWLPKSDYSDSDGTSGIVKVIHTPNHRGLKGTEFLIQAVDQLREEGLLVELILIEARPNDDIRRLMLEEADILAEAFIFPGYVLSGIEGMASGLPVLANLDVDSYTRALRRYSYLNECPVVSTPPERIKDNLRALIINPNLREELGIAGRFYVEKYHSEKTAQYMFGAVYDRVWHGKDVDLINLFHPLKSQYNHSLQPVPHPLEESRLPSSYLSNRRLNLVHSNASQYAIRKTES